MMKLLKRKNAMKTLKKKNVLKYKIVLIHRGGDEHSAGVSHQREKIIECTKLSVEPALAMFWGDGVSEENNENIILFIPTHNIVSIEKLPIEIKEIVQ